MSLNFSGNVQVQSIIGTLDIVDGGTGHTTATGAINALMPSQSSNAGKFLTTDGNVVSWGTLAGLGAGTVSSVAASGSNGVVVSGSPITTSGILNISLSNTGVTPGAYTNPLVSVDSAGRIIAISNGSSIGASVVANYVGPYVFDNTTPATDRHNIVNSPANTGGHNLGPGEMEVTLDFISSNYFTQNDAGGGHIAIVLRCDTGVIATAVKGTGMILGNVSGHPTGSPNHPTTQIETWFNGIGVGNYLPTESDGYSNKLLQDGVKYRIVISSKITDAGDKFIRYRIYREKTVYTSYLVWVLERDTGDMVDNNPYLDPTFSGLIIGHVFENASATPWTATFSNVKVVWRKAESSPATEIPSWLTTAPATGVSSFNTRTGAVTLSQADVKTALTSANLRLDYVAPDATSNSMYVTRDAQYTGGTPGWVNCALFLDTTVGSVTNHGATSFEWGITSRLNNYSDHGENVGGYLQGNKHANGPTWGGCFEVNDHRNIPTGPATGGTVGIEVDVWANDSDDHAQRIAIDVVGGKSVSTGAKAYVHAGLRIGPTFNNHTLAAFHNGVIISSAETASFVSTAIGETGVALQGTYTNAIDLSLSTNSASAIKIKSNDNIALSTDGAIKMVYNSVTGRIEFLNGSTGRGYINVASGANIDLAGSGAGVTDTDIITALGYTPASVEVLPLTIAVLGDSLTSQNAVIDESPTHILERIVNSMGGNARVYNCGRDAHTFYRAMSVNYINGMTSAEYCVSLNPDVIVIPLGINDAINNVDGRTLPEIQGDATALVTYLKTQLPTATIIYGAEIPYDTTHFTTANLKNKGTVPTWFTKRTTGILADKISTEILDDSVDAPTLGKFDNWFQLDSHIRLLPDVNHTIDIDYWKIARLGYLSPDIMHLTSAGSKLFAGYMLAGIKLAVSKFPALFDNNFPYFDDPNTVFTSSLVDDTVDGWIPSANSVLTISEVHDDMLGRMRRIDNWFMPSDLCVTHNADAHLGTKPYYFFITGARKNSEVFISLNGSAFTTTSLTTNASGELMYIDYTNTLGLVIGTNTVRFLVDTVVTTPFDVTYQTTSNVYTPAVLLNSWVNVGIPYYDAAYHKDANGLVRLRGMIKSGATTTTAFSLPIEYRPVSSMIFASIGNDVIAKILVDANGDVVLFGDTSTGISLDNIAFNV